MFGDQIGAVIGEHEFVALIVCLTVPRHDSETRSLLGLSCADDAAPRNEGVAGVDGAMKHDVVDAEKGATGLG